jgi:nucleotide-binding universal stress UspA family protein
MREALMSSGLFVARTAERERARPEDKNLKQVEGWNPEDFAREQIQGLVRQVFFSRAERPARQVVFSAAERGTDVQNLCWRVGEALALETSGDIALVGEYPRALRDAGSRAREMANPVEESSRGLRQAATRAGSNLWIVPPAGNANEQVTTALLHSYLAGVRSQFEYSIVVGLPVAESNAATAMAQLADGIVLVLSAHRTRRITARKIKDKLEGAQARLLGTVLSDRAFPIPERIYRRL